MHRNYFLFRRQTTDLNSLFKNYEIKSVFTHRKDELVLHLIRNEEFFLRISVDKLLPYIIFYPPYNIRDHSVQFFPELNGTQILKINIELFDKRIKIYTETGIMDCVFFGTQPNIYLYDESGKFLGQFKKDAKSVSEYNHGVKLNPFKPDFHKLNEISAFTSDISTIDLFKYNMAGFNSTLARELLFRCNITPSAPASALTSVDIRSIEDQLKGMMNEMNTSGNRIYFKDKIPQILSIIRLTYLEKLEIQEYNILNDAWKKFVNYHQLAKRFGGLKTQLHRALKKRIRFIERTLDRIQENKDVLAKKKDAELKGNLLLTFAHQISRGSTNISVDNIFTADAEKISIELDPSLSVQENAQKYFNKYKDIDATRVQMNIRERTYLRELQENNEILKKLDRTTAIKELSRIQQNLIEKQIIQEHGTNKKTVSPQVFKHAILEGGWSVYVGRNARNNDELTFKFARKYDIWFHAQNVKGSHTILRILNKDQQPPHKIIEQTAQIAAYHSAAQHDTVVPVLYTAVKYVRKPRKSPPGLVTTIQSKTIYVSPKNLI